MSDDVRMDIPIDKCPYCERPWPAMGEPLKVGECGRTRGAVGEVACLRAAADMWKRRYEDLKFA